MDKGWENLCTILLTFLLYTHTNTHIHVCFYNFFKDDWLFKMNIIAMHCRSIAWTIRQLEWEKGWGWGEQGTGNTQSKDWSRVSISCTSPWSLLWVGEGKWKIPLEESYIFMWWYNFICRKMQNVSMHVVISKATNEKSEL